MMSLKKMCAAVRKYGAIAKINFANKLAYPVDIVTEIVFLSFVFLILFFLYRATAAIKPTSPIEQISLAQIMWIIFFANIFTNEHGKGVSHALNDEILSGQIAYQLNRPYSYILFHFAQYLGSQLPKFIFAGLITGLFLYGLVGVPALSVGSLLLGIPMLCIGLVMSFLMQFCIGLCAFWVGYVDPIRWIYKQVMVVAGGVAIPLALFPAYLKNIILALPFSNAVYGAARIIVGCSTSDAGMYLGLQLFWLVMLILITKFIFNRGVKNVVISGG